MLEVKDLHAYYGKSHVLHGVNLFVGRGEIVSLLGRNGVGRSTTIKAIMGLVTARGNVAFQGRDDLVGLKPHEIALRGHAIEARINAESPQRNFMPTPGRLDRWVAPIGCGNRRSGRKTLHQRTCWSG